jgi:MFS family permease
MSVGLAAVLLTAGALADDFGHRRVLRCSAGMLAAASLLGALAPSMQILVAARVLQGVAGGGILTASLGSIGHTFPSGPARTHATAIWGAAVGAGVTVGPLAAAGLGQAAGWRSGFWFEAAAATALTMVAATLSPILRWAQGWVPHTTRRRADATNNYPQSHSGGPHEPTTHLPPRPGKTLRAGVSR